MPTPPKTTENMTKHMTAAQLQARQMAEEQLQPIREQVTLKKPPWLKGNGARYWKDILARMEGTIILDDLDSEMLATYCSQLERKAALEKDLETARKAKDQAAIAKISDDVLALERLMLQYSEKLGCTPSGRVRLAVKRAAAAAEADPNGDLFGD